MLNPSNQAVACNEAEFIEVNIEAFSGEIYKLHEI